jgi:hypothetical protein
MEIVRLAVIAGAAAVMSLTAAAADFDVHAFFARALDEGRVGMAQKTKSVEARPAKVGEVVVTIIADEGVETKSKPAEAGDMVVRNVCSTEDGEYLVKAAKFAQRYGEPTGEADSEGWRPYEPKGVSMRYLILRADEGPFTFLAPWGEDMVAKPADALVQDPNNPADTYRIARYAFDCTYEITEPAKAS